MCNYDLGFELSHDHMSDPATKRTEPGSGYLMFQPRTFMLALPKEAFSLFSLGIGDFHQNTVFLLNAVSNREIGIQEKPITYSSRSKNIFRFLRPCSRAMNNH